MSESWLKVVHQISRTDDPISKLNKSVQESNIVLLLDFLLRIYLKSMKIHKEMANVLDESAAKISSIHLKTLQTFL